MPKTLFVLLLLCVQAFASERTIVGVNAFPSVDETIYSRSTNRTQIIRQMYEPLFLIEENYQLTSPYLEYWKVNTKRTTFEFAIKPNQKFQDGTDLTAQHIKDIFERRNPDGNRLFSNVKSIVLKNNLVTVSLYSPSYDLIEKLSDLPASLTLKKFDSFGYPIGSGAFRFKSISKDEITLERNPNHRDFKNGTIEVLAFKLLNESVYTIESVKKMGISFFPLIRIENSLDGDDQKSGFKEIIYPSHRVNALVLNIKDPSIRKIIDSCMPRDTLLSLPYLKGSITPYNSIVPPGIENYQPNDELDSIHNSKNCKRSLEGNTKRIKLKWLNSYDDQKDVAFLTALVARLNKSIFPLEVELVTQNLTEVHKTVASGDFDIFLCGVASPYPLADGILSDFFYTKGDTHKLLKFEDNEFSKIMKLYRNTYGEKRTAQIDKAVNHLIKSSLVIPIGRRTEKYYVPTDWKDLLLVNGMNGNFYLGKVKFDSSKK